MRVIGEADNDTIFSATASGSLPNGSSVIVNTAGTVSIVEDSDIAFGDETHVTSSTNGVYMATCFDGVNNRFVIVYIDNNDSSYGKAVVGEVDGTSITFGTPVNFNAGDTGYIDVDYNRTDPSKVVICFRNQAATGNPGQAIVGVITGNSIAFGTAVTYSGSYASWANKITHIGNPANKFVIVYREITNNSNDGMAVVATVSGTNTISFLSPVQFLNASSQAENFCITNCGYSSQDVLVLYQDGGNVVPYGRIGRVDANSGQISFNSETAYTTQNNAVGTKIVWDHSHTNRAIIAFRAQQNNSYLQVVIANVAGTSVSFYDSGYYTNYSVDNISLVYDNRRNRTSIFYRDNANKLRLFSVTLYVVSGTNYVVYDNPGDPASSDTTPYIESSGNGDHTAIAFGNSISGSNPDVDKVLCVYTVSSNALKAKVVQPADRFVKQPLTFPIASTSISGGNTSSPMVMYDPNADRLIYAYVFANGNGCARTAKFGTDNLTIGNYGTEVLFETPGTVQYISGCYVTHRNQFFLIYRDNGSSSTAGRITGVVGTVNTANGDITFGSPKLISNGAGSYPDCCYDPVNKKVVAVWSDSQNNNCMSAVIDVLTVGSNVPANATFYFSSIVQVIGGNVNDVTIVYHPTAKQVVVNVSHSGSSSHGKLIAGTIGYYHAGGITWGTPSTYKAAAVEEPKIGYDASVDKLVITYDLSADSSGYCLVASLSGGSFSTSSTHVQYRSGVGGPNAIVYNEHAEQTIIISTDSSNRGKFYLPNFDGFFVSFPNGETASKYNNFSSNYFGISYPYGNSCVTYDPDTKLIVVAGEASSEIVSSVIVLPGSSLKEGNFVGFTEAGFSDTNTVTVKTANAIIGYTKEPDDSSSGLLAAGKKYFVRKDGRLSLNAQTPSVEAGTGVASTGSGSPKLIVKG